MKNRLFLAYTLLGTLTSMILYTGNEEPHIPINLPPLHPIEEKVVPETFVPEFGYYFTKQASKENILMGPCSPCVCMQICNPHNDECLYVHQNFSNDHQAPLQKIRKHFTVSNNKIKPDLNITIFTNHDKQNTNRVNFSEGSHQKRILKLSEVLEKDGVVGKKDIYYNETPWQKDETNGYADRVILFKQKQSYRIDAKQQEGIKQLDLIQDFKDFRLSTYLDLKLRKMFADRIYWSHQNSISKKIHPLRRWL